MSQRREGKKKQKSEKRVIRKKIKVREKGKIVANHSVFPTFCGSGGLKSRLAQAGGGEPFCGLRDEQLHAVVTL